MLTSQKTRAVLHSALPSELWGFRVSELSTCSFSWRCRTFVAMASEKQQLFPVVPGQTQAPGPTDGSYSLIVSLIRKRSLDLLDLGPGLVFYLSYSAGRFRVTVEPLSPFILYVWSPISPGNSTPSPGRSPVHLHGHSPGPRF